MQNADQRPLVFVDTNVLVEYLKGSTPESSLFSDKMLRRFRFAINPIVASEILLAADAKEHTDKLDKIQDVLEILPVNDAELGLFSKKMREFRNKMVHSNEILISSTAAECDYLLTEDQIFKNLFETEKPVILTTEEFIQNVERL